MEHITAKQLEILQLVYRFRFLDRSHIQQLLNHKDPKRINVWLKDLTEKRILGRHYSTKLKENTKPAIYYLATKSRLILLDQDNINPKILKRAYRDKNCSKRLIEHYLFIAHFYLQLNKQTKMEGSKLHFFTKTDLLEHYYLPFNRPDAYISLEGKNETKRYFLELIDEGTPRFMLRKKIQSYFYYFDQNSWTKHTGYDNPSLLFVCPNVQIHDFLQKFIASTKDEETSDLQFFTSLMSQIQASGITKTTWHPVET